MMLAVREVAEELAEEVGSMILVVGCGVAVLGLEGGSELDTGLEERAGFADGLEGAVELGGSGAVAVAEVSVVFSAQSCHLGSDRIGGQWAGRRRGAGQSPWQHADDGHASSRPANRTVDRRYIGEYDEQD
jgi:hypothetical protein